jgi:Tfp pilus assembly protein PilZ
MAARVAWIVHPRDANPHVAGMGVAFTDPQQIAALARDLEALDREGETPPPQP